jgi:hypothetical protein
MKTYKYTITDWYFNNRWSKRKLSRTSDWTIIGLRTRWVNHAEFCYCLCFFGLDFNLWFKREEIV